jgi:addiction module RelE/StbE family toxin
MYKIEVTNAVKKDIKNLSKNIQAKINDIFLTLTKNPELGERLSGEFYDCFSIHFKVYNIQYRIIYKVYNNELIILVILVGTRENIYKQLKRRT